MAGSRELSRVVLHVGLPKSGTTYLQHSLAANAEALADRGVLYPQTADDVMFRAALDVRGNHKAWGRPRSRVQGTWDLLCAQARGHTGTTVLSHELLAAASQRQVVAAMTMLQDLDVHLVVTVRDPARQLVSEWQEGIKHGRQHTFAEFADAVRSGGGGVAAHVRAAQDLLDVLDRWGGRLPADHVHVVVGAPDADPARLWASFGRAVGFDADGFPPAPGSRGNPSLGVAEIDLLRRVNGALDGRLKQPEYGRLVKHRVAHDLLAVRRSPRPQLPADLYDVLVPMAERWVKEVEAAGYVVHGDLADLVPVVPEQPGVHPDAVDDPGLGLELASSVLAEVLLDLAAARREAARKDAKRKTWKTRAKKLRKRLAATA